MVQFTDQGLNGLVNAPYRNCKHLSLLVLFCWEGFAKKTQNNSSYLDYTYPVRWERIDYSAKDPLKASVHHVVCVRSGDSRSKKNKALENPSGISDYHTEVCISLAQKKVYHLYFKEQIHCWRWMAQLMGSKRVGTHGTLAFSRLNNHCPGFEKSGVSPHHRQPGGSRWRVCLGLFWE